MTLTVKDMTCLNTVAAKLPKDELTPIFQFKILGNLFSILSTPTFANSGIHSMEKNIKCVIEAPNSVDPSKIYPFVDDTLLKLRSHVLPKPALCNLVECINIVN